MVDNEIEPGQKLVLKQKELSMISILVKKSREIKSEEPYTINSHHLALSMNSTWSLGATRDKKHIDFL